MASRQPYESSETRQRCRRIIRLLEEGKFLVARFPPTSGWGAPLPFKDELGVIHAGGYDHASSSYIDAKTSWGIFKSDNDSNAYVLIKGDIPEKYLPQEKPFLGEVVIHPRHVVVKVGEREIEADIQVTEKYGSNILREINAALWADDIKVMVWRYDWSADYDEDQDSNQIFNLNTEHVGLVASSVVFDPVNNELVAAQVMPRNKQELVAFRATLADNSRKKNWIRVSVREKQHYLNGSKKGFLAVGSNMQAANALGSVVVLLHPLTGDPQLWPDEKWFYVVGISGEDIMQKFAERLDLCISWPTPPEWAQYLYDAGKSKGLIRPLYVLGDEFTNGFLVYRHDEKWADVISRGIKDKAISIDNEEVINNGASSSAG